MSKEALAVNALRWMSRSKRARGIALVVWTALVILAGGTAGWGAEASPGAPEPPWFRRLLVGMEVGPTGAQFGSDPSDVGYAARFDGRDVVRRCVEAGCEYLVIWARDGEYAYYESRLMPKCPGLGKRDVLREAVDEARKSRLPVIAYCVVQAGGYAYQRHPEFRMRDAAGREIGRMCFNTGYAEFMKRLLAEMVAYGIDGFHIDMLDQGFGPPYGCWCDACRKRFQSEYQRPMPKGVTWDEDWDRMLEFRYATSQRLERELCAHVKSIRPGTSVDFNYHGNPPFSWEVGQRPVEHAGNADFVTGETGVWGFSALGVGLNAEFYRAATPGAPFQVAMQRGVRMYHDQTTRPLNDMRWELLTLLAHGAFVTMVDKTAYDGWLDPVAYQRIGEAFRDARAKREHFGHRPVQEVGIYFSSRTRDWVGREQPQGWMQSFLGAHKALVYEHIPCGVLLDENVTSETLRRYPIVLLPNVGILSPREIDLVRRYVDEGGNLIATGHTGLSGWRGERLDKSAIADLIGAQFVERLESLDNHVRFPDGAKQTAGGGSLRPSEDEAARAALRGSIPAGWPLLVKGPAAVFKPTTALAIGELLRPHRTVRQRQGKEGTDWPMSADAPVGPAMLFNRLGRGRVLTPACSPDYATASEHHVVEARKLLLNAVRFLHPQPLVEITAPASVEAVVSDDPAARTLRVHLLAYQSPAQTMPAQNRPYVLPALIEDAPLYRATIRLRRPVEEVRALGKTTQLSRDGDRIALTVEDIHEVVVIRYGPSPPDKR